MCKEKEHYIGERERSDFNFFFTLMNGDAKLLFEIFDVEVSLVSWEGGSEGRKQVLLCRVDLSFYSQLLLLLTLFTKKTIM